VQMDVGFDRCVKFEKSNDQTQLIFGSLSVIQARDAVSLPVGQLSSASAAALLMWLSLPCAC